MAEDSPKNQNKPAPKKQDKGPHQSISHPEDSGILDPRISAQVLSMIKDQHDREMGRLESSMNSHFDQLSSQIKDVGENINDRIDSLDMRVKGEIDSIDKALRGNGRIGLFEQMRNAHTKVRIIFVILVLLLGFKIWGLGFDEWLQSFFVTTEEVIEQPAAINDTDTEVDG